MTQDRLAELAEMSIGGIQSIEYCKTWPSRENLAAIAKALGVEVPVLFVTELPKIEPTHAEALNVVTKGLNLSLEDIRSAKKLIGPIDETGLSAGLRDDIIRIVQGTASEANATLLRQQKESLDDLTAKYNQLLSKLDQLAQSNAEFRDPLFEKFRFLVNHNRKVAEMIIGKTYDNLAGKKSDKSTA